MTPKVLYPIVSVLMLCCWFPATTQAQTTMWTGVVKDARTGAGLPGASVRVVGTNRGTYAGADGRFRLPLSPQTWSVNVRSVGYRDTVLTITPDRTSLVIGLTEAATLAPTTTVIGAILPEEIIRRAIARKDENARRITSLVSTTYSKTRTDFLMDGVKNDTSNVIAETFATIYDQRQPERRKHVVIQNRRQTRNISAAQNLMVFDEFFDFTMNELTIFNTRLVTPLGDDALDEYRYTLAGRRPLGDKYVYEVDFEPQARIFPGFTGRLVIVEGTWQVIEASFRPTDETAFPFLKKLSFDQRYERMTDSIWVPTYQRIRATANMAVFTGLLSVDAGVTVDTYVSDVVVNQPIADSLLRPSASTSQYSVSMGTGSRDDDEALTLSGEHSQITVAPGADSARSEFWEARAYAEQTEEERKIYRRADSIEANRDTTAPKNDGPSVTSTSRFGNFTFNVAPLLNRTSITGMLYGVDASVKAYGVTLGVSGGFGSESTRAGRVALGWDIVRTKASSLSVEGSVFSQPVSLQQPRSVLERFASLNVGNIIFAEYFDFYRSDGTDVQVQYTTGRVSAVVQGAWARHVDVPVISPPDDRTPLPVRPGDYRTITVGLTLAEPSVMDRFLGQEVPFFGGITGLIGDDTRTGRTFSSITARVGSVIHTFATGYRPMALDIYAEGTLTSVTAPPQYQGAVIRRYPVFGSSFDPMTVPVSRYGGTSVVVLGLEHNFTDIWWRFLGLPTFNGRGPDLLGTVSAVNTVQRSTLTMPMWGATNGWYTEAGFGLARIPSFFSDLLYFRFDARWPVGPLAAPVGSFGWSIGISSPLL